MYYVDNAVYVGMYKGDFTLKILVKCQVGTFIMRNYDFSRTVGVNAHYYTLYTN